MFNYVKDIIPAITVLIFSIAWQERQPEQQRLVYVSDEVVQAAYALQDVDFLLYRGQQKAMVFTVEDVAEFEGETSETDGVFIFTSATKSDSTVIIKVMPEIDSTVYTVFCEGKNPIVTRYGKR